MDSPTIQAILLIVAALGGGIGGREAFIWIWKEINEYRKSKESKRAIEISQTADVQKAKLEYEFKLEELADKQIWAIIESREKEIDDLKADIIVWEEKFEKFAYAEEKRKENYLKKLFLLREHRRELEHLELEVLKLNDKNEFQTFALLKIKFLKTNCEEHEKLLS